MNVFSMERLSDIVSGRRHSMKLSQAELSRMTGLNRATISKIEQGEYTPSIPQLQALSQTLNFDMTEVFVEEKALTPPARNIRRYNIAVAGTGYVGLSIATLLAQHNHVTAVDIIPEKVALINDRKSPIQDEYIEKYLAEKELDLTATLDGESAYRDADFVIIAAPTNYDSKKNYFDCSAVDSEI